MDKWYVGFGLGVMVSYVPLAIRLYPKMWILVAIGLLIALWGASIQNE